MRYRHVIQDVTDPLSAARRLRSLPQSEALVSLPQMVRAERITTRTRGQTGAGGDGEERGTKPRDASDCDAVEVKSSLLPHFSDSHALTGSPRMDSASSAPADTQPGKNACSLH